VPGDEKKVTATCHKVFGSRLINGVLVEGLYDQIPLTGNRRLTNLGSLRSPQ
jgi:hypothetical protein